MRRKRTGSYEALSPRTCSRSSATNMCCSPASSIQSAVLHSLQTQYGGSSARGSRRSRRLTTKRVCRFPNGLQKIPTHCQQCHRRHHRHIRQRRPGAKLCLVVRIQKLFCIQGGKNVPPIVSYDSLAAATIRKLYHRKRSNSWMPHSNVLCYSAGLYGARTETAEKFQVKMSTISLG